ncbi:hypothetical protein [Caldimonas sp. KR1-144]|uniref:hypothetical protein n=1 Tax=Caldimonas sp. KR1-144 TaxID=3400911 RepID=UPI003C110E18
MNASRTSSSDESFASHRDAADTSPQETLALSEHLDPCEAPVRGPAAWHGAAQAASRLVAAYPVTVAFTVAAMLGGIAVLQR